MMAENFMMALVSTVYISRTWTLSQKPPYWAIIWATYAPNGSYFPSTKEGTDHLLGAVADAFLRFQHHLPGCWKANLAMDMKHKWIGWLKNFTKTQFPWPSLFFHR